MTSFSMKSEKIRHKSSKHVASSTKHHHQQQKPKLNTELTIDPEVRK